MQFKSIVAGAAVALAATVGSASAADQFATLGGVTAEPMNAGEMAAVVGAVFIIGVNPPPGVSPPWRAGSYVSSSVGEPRQPRSPLRHRPPP